MSKYTLTAMIHADMNYIVIISIFYRHPLIGITCFIDLLF